MFWKRFVKEVLLTLTKRPKWHEDDTLIKIGDLVISIVSNSPRNCWKRAIVSNVHPDEDGKIRVATVRTTSGELKRPVSKLAVLNIGSS
jgi:hypothetical protein